MKQGDKFIVIDNSTNCYEIGEVVIYKTGYYYNRECLNFINDNGGRAIS